MEIRLNQAQKQQKTSQEQIVEAQKATEVTNFNFIEFFNRIFFGEISLYKIIQQNHFKVYFLDFTAEKKLVY